MGAAESTDQMPLSEQLETDKASQCAHVPALVTVDAVVTEGAEAEQFERQASPPASPPPSIEVKPTQYHDPLPALTATPKGSVTGRLVRRMSNTAVHIGKAMESGLAGIPAAYGGHHVMAPMAYY